MRGDAKFDAYLNTKEGKKLTEDFFHLILQSAIESGRIDPKGKDEDELEQEFIKILLEIQKARPEFIWITDYRSTILQQARQFRRADDARLACLLYGTWLEHWLNWLIATVGKQRGLREEEITQIIRDVPFRGKMTWMFPLLGLRQLPTNHKNAIFRVTDLRNSFVHYKWKGLDDTADEREEEEFKRSLDIIEKTVKYLGDYENKYVFHRKKKALRRITKLPKS